VIEMEDTDEVIPDSTDLGFFPLTTSDWWVSLAIGAIGVIGWARTNILMLIPVMIVWLLLMARRDSGRVYFLIVAGAKGIWRMRVKKGVVWVPTVVGNGRQTSEPAAGEGAEADRWRKKLRRQPSETTVIPFATTSVPVSGDEEAANIGILHDTREHTDSIVIVAEGSAIAGMSLLDQRQAHRRIAETIKQAVTLQRGYRVGISFIFSRRPFDGFALSAEMDQLLHPDVAVPDGLEVPEDELTPSQRRALLVSANMHAVQAIPTQYGCEVWMAVIVTIRREGVLARAQASRSINPQYAGKLPINKMAQAVMGGLAEGGVNNPRALDRGELHTFVRGAWDLVTLDEYYEQVHQDPTLPDEENFVGHWPSKEMRVTHRYSVTDGTYSAVLRIKGVPGKVWQGFFRELSGGLKVPYFSIAHIGDSVRSDKQVFWMERGVAILDTVAELMGKDRQTRKSQERDRRANDRLDELFNAGFSQNSIHLITVHAGSAQELEEYIDQVVQYCMLLKVQCAHITGAELQYAALWSGGCGLSTML
jgi:hypothetical protein